MKKTKTVLKVIIAVLSGVLLIYAILPKDTLEEALKKQVDEVSANHKFYAEQVAYWSEKEKVSAVVLNGLLDAYNALGGEKTPKTAVNEDFEAYASSSEPTSDTKAEYPAGISTNPLEYSPETIEAMGEEWKNLPIHRWQYTDDLLPTIQEYWKNSVLEDKAEELIEWCKESSVPRVCVKLIAVKTQYETGKGTTGRGVSQRNLTGITCSQSGNEEFAGIKYSFKCQKGFRTYTQYYYALLDSVRLFIEGNYQDYFTLYGWPNGLKRFLNQWGGSIHYREMLYDLNNW